MADIDWEGKPWRKPDEHVEDWAVWYGPAGVEGDVATEIEAGSFGYTVREYQGVTWSEDSEESILVTETYVSDEDLSAILRKRGVREPQKNLDWLRLAVGYGVAYMGYWGGDESWAAELPR